MRAGLPVSIITRMQDDPEKNPVFWKRKDYPDVVYRTEEAKFRAITREILHLQRHGPADAGRHHLG